MELLRVIKLWEESVEVVLFLEDERRSEQERKVELFLKNLEHVDDLLHFALVLAEDTDLSVDHVNLLSVLIVKIAIQGDSEHHGLCLILHCLVPQHFYHTILDVIPATSVRAADPSEVLCKWTATSAATALPERS